MACPAAALHLLPSRQSRPQQASSLGIIAQAAVYHISGKPLGFYDHLSSSRPVPAAAVYNALLEACAQSRDEERGSAIIERMRAAGVNPNEFTFRAVDKRKVLRRQISRLFSAQQSDDES